MKNRTFAVVVLFFLLSACAPRQEIKPVEAPPPPPTAEAPAPPPETTVAEKRPVTPKEAKQAEQYVMLNFVNADLDNVIQTVGEMLKINYLLAPGVTGKITIQSHNKIPLSQLFATFQTILQTNGFTAVKDGEFYKIVPIDTAKQESLPVVAGKTPTMPADASFITQEIPISYVKAADVANIMRNLMPRGADIVVYEPSNSLIVTAPPSTMLKFLKILEAVDVPPSERDAVRTFVYYVENGEAKKLVEILKNLYASKKAEGGVKSVTPSAVPAPIAPGRIMGRAMQPAAQPETPAPTGGVLEGLAGEIEGPVTIEAYEDINALVVKTTPRGYISLLQTLKKLDVQPKQVLIEVMIAEVSLDKSTQFGLEWLLKANAKVGGEQLGMIGGFATSTNSGFLPQFDTSQNQFVVPTASSTTAGTTTGGTILSHPADVFATIIDPSKFSALVTAAATKGKVNVIASPNILALDNKEAKIEIGNEVPVATSITQPLAGATTTEITATSQVQFKTVGTLLTVTPHINAKKEVTLKISQEVSAIGSTVLIGGQSFTGFTTRKANTTAIVQDGHTLVLGGIIQENDSKSSEGIPFLSDIPILGYLFGTSSDHVTRSELIVMVTPHVISDTEDADEVTREVTNRVKALREKLKEQQEQLRKNAAEAGKEDSGR
jgi:general secretion pathway protein D